MPLLLKHEAPSDPPGEAELEVPADGARAFPVARGQLLTITDVTGNRPAALYAFTKADPRVFLSPHHTRVFSNSFVLCLGMRLVTNRRHPILVLGKDTSQHHDLMMPASTTAYLESQGIRGRRGVVESVDRALRDAGLAPPRVPDPVNLFAHVSVEPDGRLVPRPHGSKAGDHVTFRVVIDSTCVVSTCLLGLWSPEASGPVRIRIHNHV